MTVYYRACPRCHGDLQVNKDVYGEYKECLQCGYMLDTLDKIKRNDNYHLSKEKSGGKRQVA